MPLGSKNTEIRLIAKLRFAVLNTGSGYCIHEVVNILNLAFHFLASIVASFSFRKIVRPTMVRPPSLQLKKCGSRIRFDKFFSYKEGKILDDIKNSQ